MLGGDVFLRRHARRSPEPRAECGAERVESPRLRTHSGTPLPLSPDVACLPHRGRRAVSQSTLDAM